MADLPSMFVSALSKVMRAKKQSEELVTEIDRFLEADYYEIRQELDPNTGRKAAVFRSFHPLPAVEWSIRLGEIIHNLRSALDHAITDLTVAKNGKSLEGTGFPIFKDKALYDGKGRSGSARQSGVYKIRGVSDRAKAAIRREQPFEDRARQAANDYSTLALLHDLNIIDKHRSIPIVRQYLSGGEFGIGVSNFTWHLSHGIEDGTKLASWDPSPLETSSSILRLTG